MGRIFNMDNPFFTFMGRVADLMILNFLFILCCLPIFTIGDACTALFYVTLKMVRNEETYIVKSFFKSFKQNFKQATGIWLIILAMLVLLVMDFSIMNQMDGTFATVIKYGLIIIALVVVMLFLYVFPVLAKFDNTVKNTMKNALLMSIRHLPQTIVMLLISVVPTVLSVLFLAYSDYGSYSILAWMLVGLSLTALANSWFFVRIFDKYIPDEAKEDGLAAEDAEDMKYEEEIPGVTPAFGRRFANAEPENESAENPSADDNSDSEAADESISGAGAYELTDSGSDDGNPEPADYIPEDGGSDTSK